MVNGLAPVVQRVDSIPYWISCYPVDEICRKNSIYSQMNLIQNEGESIRITTWVSPYYGQLHNMDTRPQLFKGWIALSTG